MTRLRERYSDGTVLEVTNNSDPLARFASLLEDLRQTEHHLADLAHELRDEPEFEAIRRRARATADVLGWVRKVPQAPPAGDHPEAWHLDELEQLAALPGVQALIAGELNRPLLRSKAAEELARHAQAALDEVLGREGRPTRDGVSPRVLAGQIEERLRPVVGMLMNLMLNDAEFEAVVDGADPSNRRLQHDVPSLVDAALASHMRSAEAAKREGDTDWIDAFFEPERLVRSLARALGFATAEPSTPRKDPAKGLFSFAKKRKRPETRVQAERPRPRLRPRSKKK